MLEKMVVAEWERGNVMDVANFHIPSQKSSTVSA